MEGCFEENPKIYQLTLATVGLIFIPFRSGHPEMDADPKAVPAAIRSANFTRLYDGLRTASLTPLVVTRKFDVGSLFKEDLYHDPL